MGLIRKSLAIGTVGVVRPSSKKQRNQKKLIKQSRVSNQLAAAQLHAQLQTQADAQQALAHAQAQTAYLQAQARAAQAAIQPQGTQQPAIAALAPGWYNDPSGDHVLRYYDGQSWTDHTTPLR